MLASMSNLNGSPDFRSANPRFRMKGARLMKVGSGNETSVSFDITSLSYQNVMSCFIVTSDPPDNR